jgi:hypothetical protein
VLIHIELLLKQILLCDCTVTGPLRDRRSPQYLVRQNDAIITLASALMPQNCHTKN